MNWKNNTPLLLQRLATAQSGQSGMLVQAMVNFFRANFGVSDLPKTVADFVLYDQQAVAGVTSIQYFTGNYSVARSNFPTNNFQLPQGEHALILGIKAMTGANAAIQSTDWQPGINDAITRNGLVTININGNRVITQLPLTAFDNTNLSATSSGETDDSRGMFYLYEPLVLLGQTSMDALVTWGTAPTTLNQNLRFELHGIRFIGN